MELKGKYLADLRNKEIKEMLITLEKQRDDLYDEIANRKGRLETIEDIIKEIYDRIIQVNKDIHQQELAAEVQKRAEEEEQKRKEADQKEKEDEKDAFEKAKRGIKTPKAPRRKRPKKKKE